MNKKLVKTLLEDVKLGTEGMVGYWIDPEGKESAVWEDDGGHFDWILQHADGKLLGQLYKETGYSEVNTEELSDEEFDKYEGDLVNALVRLGWVRVDTYEDSIYFTIVDQRLISVCQEWINSHLDEIMDAEEVILEVGGKHHSASSMVLKWDEVRDYGLRKAMINFRKSGGVA